LQQYTAKESQLLLLSRDPARSKDTKSSWDPVCPYSDTAAACFKNSHCLDLSGQRMLHSADTSGFRVMTEAVHKQLLTC